MKHSKQTKAKIGIVKFLNTAPVYETWKRTVSKQVWEIVEGSPAELGRELAGGHIDLGFVSSFEYGLNPDRYKILSGLSISAKGSADSVGSVFLFSHVPLDQLNQSTVFLSSQSETTVALVKIILEEFNKITPDYIIGDINSAEAEEHNAVLAIGDDALRLVAKSTYLYQFDLADIWKRETGLPFVFEICAVREDFYLQNKKLIDEIHKELLRCRSEGVNVLKEICTIAAPRIPLPVSGCVEYLQAMEYNLGAQEQKSLAVFFDFLIERCEIKKNALPLKIYSNLC